MIQEMWGLAKDIVARNQKSNYGVVGVDPVKAHKVFNAKSVSDVENDNEVMSCAAYGDALYLSYRWKPLEPSAKIRIRGLDMLSAGSWTHETSLGLIVAKSLSISQDDSIVEYIAKDILHWWGENRGTYPNEGTSRIVEESLYRICNEANNRSSTTETSAIMRSLADELNKTNDNDWSTRGLFDPSIKLGRNISRTGDHLFRLHPIALMDISREIAAKLALEVASLTHANTVDLSAAVLWVEMLRTARSQGVIDFLAGIDLIDVIHPYILRNSRGGKDAYIEINAVKSFWRSQAKELLVTPTHILGQKEPTSSNLLQQIASLSLRNRNIIFSPEGGVESIIRDVCSQKNWKDLRVLILFGAVVGALGAGMSDMPIRQNELLHGSWGDGYLPLDTKDMRDIENQLRGRQVIEKK